MAFTESVLTSLLAGIILDSAKEVGVVISESDEKKLLRLQEKVALARSKDNEWEIAIAKAFRVFTEENVNDAIIPLFNNITFKKLLITWVFDLDKAQKTTTKKELVKCADNMQMNNAQSFINNLCNVLEKNIAGDEFLKYLVDREDHHKIYRATKEGQHLHDKEKIISLLIDCHDAQVNDFNHDWPYAIEEDMFVDIYDYSSGLFKNDLQTSAESPLLAHLVESISNYPLILLGYYGMGKTTIARYIFKNWNEIVPDTGAYPLFINLYNRNLDNFTAHKFWDSIAAELRQALESSQKTNISVNWGNAGEYIRQAFMEYNIILIFDAIDEAYAPSESLNEFLHILSGLPGKCFLTSRLEFGPLIDFAARLDNLHRVTLFPWAKKQWQEYRKALLRKGAAKKDSVDSFFNHVENDYYQELPSRPLFLKMLVDLETDPDSPVEEKVRINRKLRTNLAEVYNKFIKWKIRDDLNRKKGSLSDKAQGSLTISNGFNVLCEFARSEYWLSRKMDHNSYSEDKLLDAVNIKHILKYLNIPNLTYEVFWEILTKSSLFSVLRKDHEEDYIFSFSHKSFYEYLFAFNLAECLFNLTLEPSIVENAWRTFQTHEVSQLFLKELQRRQVDQGISEDEQKIDIEKRFLEYLSAYKSWPDYDELIEEFIYYSGKLELKGKAILDFLNKIIERDDLHPVYYRAASLALACVLNPTYCEKYVLDLLPVNSKLPKSFHENREIQLRYYGEAKIRERLWPDIEPFLNGGNTSDIFSLKLFSYFTARIPLRAEIEELRLQLKRFKGPAIAARHSNLEKICDGIETVWAATIQN